MAPDIRPNARPIARRFRLRIRDVLVAVIIAALVAAGVAQVIRTRRLQVDRELADALRWQEILTTQEALNKEMIRLEEEVKKLDLGEETLKQFEASPGRDGVLPNPDRKGLPANGRTVL